MQQLKPRTGHMAILLLLLILTVVCMISLKSCKSYRNTTNSASLQDTINVGLQYSSTSFFMNGDTLCGFNYDLLHIIATDHGITFRYIPITTSIDGLTGLKSGRFDIITADTSATLAPNDSLITTDQIYPINNSESCIWILSRQKSGLCDSINTWLSQIKATNQYKILCNKYLK